MTFNDVCPASTETMDTINIVEFWASVLNLRNAGNEQPFKELALFALKNLTLPVSNAVVERAFSVMNLLKTKRRNRLQLLMLDSLMRLRLHMKVRVDKLLNRGVAPRRLCHYSMLTVGFLLCCSRKVSAAQRSSPRRT